MDRRDRGGLVAGELHRRGQRRRVARRLGEAERVHGKLRLRFQETSPPSDKPLAQAELTLP